VTAETRNIGVGGAFIVSQLGQPVGSEIAVELTLPTTDQTFALPAVVRWAAPDGMGVQFVGVDVDVLLELNDFFATLTA
jgi:Tfp pilus assembly protein PilZ